jgi:hypothetical protein
MFKTLSVAESNYESDIMVFEHTTWKTDKKFRIEISCREKIAFAYSSDSIRVEHFTRSDLKSFILALQEAETFLAEAELVDKLMGR